MKRFLFRYYTWILLIFGLGVSIWFFSSGRKQGIETTVYFTIIGSFVSFFYFIQKQKLEETQLFKELFNSFNARYDKMNAELNQIRMIDPQKNLGRKHREILDDYFNLCAEEYLYFKKEYIDKEVWQAWCNGMYFYLQNERIKKIWQEEERTGSYYGLTFNKIEKTALDSRQKQKHTQKT